MRSPITLDDALRLNPAQLGPSGSGKSTLLDVLAGRKTTGALSGSLSYGGETPTRTFLKRHTGYVEQQDSLVDVLTVRSSTRPSVRPPCNAALLVACN